MEIGRSPSGSEAERGHRLGPHTADVTIQAWGPTLAACAEEAVTALAEVTAEVAACAETAEEEVNARGGTPADVLVDLLDQAIVHAEVEGRLVSAARLHDTDDGCLAGTFTTVAVADTVQVGPVPKAVTRHALDVSADAGGWTAHLVVDV